MSTEIEGLLRRFAEEEDRRTPPVTLAEVVNRIDEMASPDGGADLVVVPVPPGPARRPVRRRLVIGAVAAATIAIALTVAVATRGAAPSRRVQVGNFPVTGVAPQPAGLSSPALSERAQRFVSVLASGDRRSLSQYFTPFGGRTQQDLEVAWTRFEQAYGNYLGQGKPTDYLCTGTCTTPPGQGSYRLVDVPVILARAQIYLQFYFVPQGGIDLVLFVPPDAPAAALSGQSLQLTDVTGADPSAVANSVVGDLVSGRDQAVTARYSPTATAGVSPTAAQIQQEWQTTIARFGTLSAIGTVAYTGSGLDNLDYAADLVFTRGATSTHVQIRVALDSKLRIGLIQLIVAQPNGGPLSQTLNNQPSSS